MITLGVIGGRDLEDRSVYSNQNYVDAQMEGVIQMFKNSEIDLVLGGSKGSEMLVQNWAERKGFKCRVIPPRIRHFQSEADGDNLAFKERNNRIIGASTVAVFFWDGMIPVIKDAIITCASFKKPSFVFPMV